MAEDTAGTVRREQKREWWELWKRPTAGERADEGEKQERIYGEVTRADTRHAMGMFDMVQMLAWASRTDHAKKPGGRTAETLRRVPKSVMRLIRAYVEVLTNPMMHTLGDLVMCVVYTDPQRISLQPRLLAVQAPSGSWRCRVFDVPDCPQQSEIRRKLQSAAAVPNEMKIREAVFEFTTAGHMVAAGGVWEGLRLHKRSAVTVMSPGGEMWLCRNFLDTEREKFALLAVSDTQFVVWGGICSQPSREKYLLVIDVDVPRRKWTGTMEVTCKHRVFDFSLPRSVYQGIPSSWPGHAHLLHCKHDEVLIFSQETVDTRVYTFNLSRMEVTRAVTFYHGLKILSANLGADNTIILHGLRISLNEHHVAVYDYDRGDLVTDWHPLRVVGGLVCTFNTRPVLRIVDDLSFKLDCRIPPPPPAPTPPAV